jgi:hypothetical protein
MTMPLLTIFTAPKPFLDPHIALIQRNAIRSWLHLGEEVEVLLIGDEPGLADFAAELRIAHLPQVQRNKWGTPLVSSIFELARCNSCSPMLAYVNADILLMPEFVEVARTVSRQAEQFLIVGQRWDLAIQRELDFDRDWVKQLQAEVRAHGKLHRPGGSDYFIFPRQMFSDMPDFAIGRAGWDNWMIFHACRQNAAVVDATPSLMVIHQEHGYAHLPNNRPHYDLEESSHNMIMAGGRLAMYTILDTNYQLIGGKLRPPRPSALRLLRRVERWLMPKDANRRGWRYALARKVRRLRRRLTGSL